jgi:hypothetical protein
MVGERERKRQGRRTFFDFLGSSTGMSSTRPDEAAPLSFASAAAMAAFSAFDLRPRFLPV